MSYILLNLKAGRTLKRGAQLFLLALIAVVLVGCAAGPRYRELAGPPGPNESNIELNRSLAILASEAAGSGEYIIGPEDLLEITLYDIEDNQGEPRIVESRVSSSGFVTLPYIGKVPAEGFTPIDFESDLRFQYKKYIRQPQISVLVKEFRSYSVSVMGYVRAPGIVELKGRKTLVEVIALAGGLDEDAGQGVRLSRHTEAGVHTVLVDLESVAERGDMTANVVVMPGDVVTVPKAGMFYVEGSVKTPGVYPLLQPTTVSQAVATAGGADVALANLSGAKVFRRLDSGERVAIPIDLDAISKGRGDDFMVTADDVVVVPVSGVRLLADRLSRGVLRVGMAYQL
jgi:polysaccharide export outer membrane protein